ncbi:hypothetical protein SELMODRAFT_414494 [Selaginella moellendorffii]|uniref:FERM domain-containing protein n=1 Tax=Selaginella moellendorffii TaxID=88036 RepID=D8RSY6_SELML|nr:hypothetical protein SELMODRAFT_414494 [Selaginella moellendorffii]
MDPAGSPDILASPINAAAAESNVASSSSPAAAPVAAEAEQAQSSPPLPNPAPGIVIQEPVLAGTHDHEASTSGGGGDDQSASPWLASPASTSALQSPPHSPVERALNELAFSRFRNNMRVEARRSSARRSLLGRLGALPGDETTFSQPKDQHPWQLQNPIPSFQGQDGMAYPPSSAVSSEGSVGERPSVIAPPGGPISAYQRFARAEFAEHIYGVGRLVWKRISVDELIRHSRVTLRAPLLSSLAASPESIKAATVFAHLRNYMEDPAVPENVQPSEIKFLDTLRLMKASIAQKLEPVRQKLEPAKAKVSELLNKIDKVLRTKFFIQRTRLYHLQQILLIGIKYKAVRDEIYCQICKQTTLNPARVSDARGWQAMAVCAGTFPPSEKFRPVLEEHLKQIVDGIVGGMPDQEKARSMALYCLNRLRKICRVGARQVAPSSEEILASEVTKHMHVTSISVAIPGGLAQVVSMDSMTTGGEVTAEIAARLGLPDVGFYGIFIVTNGVERFAGTHGLLSESYTEWNVGPFPELEEEVQAFRRTRHFLVDHCAQCLYNMDPDSVLGRDLKHGISAMEHLKEKEMQEKAAREAKETDPEEEEIRDAELRRLFADVHLLFKRNWFPVEGTASSDSVRAFEYAQATYDVVHGLYVIEEADAVMLAALQLRAEHGSSTDLDKYLTVQTVENYGPKEYVTGYEKAWRSAILKKVATLPWEVDVNVCRNDYLAFLRSRCPLYGSSWFYVVPKACPQFPRELYFVLNLSGVHFVDIPLKEKLLHLRYIELCSWGYSDSSFSLVTGNMSYNMEFRLGTRNGKEIAKILQYFVQHTEL